MIKSEDFIRNMKNITNVNTIVNANTDKKLGIYIHIPFCVKKCNYCDFNSFTDMCDLEYYISALKNEIKLYKNTFKNSFVDTIFIGGGTPNAISSEYIIEIIENIKVNFNVSDNIETTLECNPCLLDIDYLKSIYKKINRLSIGAQCFDDETLKVLGRIHNVKDFENAFWGARDVGFNNISVDVMFALPNQKFKSFVKDIKKLLKYGSEHVSLYCLKIEPNTRFYYQKRFKSSQRKCNKANV